MSTRKLSERFENDLKSGILSPFVDRVKKDNTLLLCIRFGYISIYYRGGCILRIKESGDSYNVSFDKNYNKSTDDLNHPGIDVSKLEHVNLWISVLPILKQTMDFYFTSKEKLEREFQQIVVRENNYSNISNDTEYFITDVEFSVELPKSKKTGRFDLIGVRWDASERQSLKKCKPVLIEMKYGDGALDGSAGIESHAVDFLELANNEELITQIKSTIEYQYNLLFDLGLINVKKKGHISLESTSDLEIIFLLANTNPRAKKLMGLLENKELNELDKHKNINLRFFVSSFSGFGLHVSCMKDLKTFKSLLKV